MPIPNKYFIESVLPDNNSNTNPIFDNNFLIEDIRRKQEESYQKERALRESQGLKEQGFLIDDKTVNKYSRYGINYTPNAYASGALDKQLADAQSNWEKAFNSLAQTVVSEIGLGTIGAFADLFDFVGSNILHITNDDYQNPVSKTIEDWQNYFNENIAPIYTTPGVDILNGGMKDFGWWMSNIPSIASSLTLLIPARITSAGIGALGKAMKVDKATSKARSWLGAAKKVEAGGKQNAFNRWIVNPEDIAKRERFYKNVAEGTLMRTMENYQEARQVHTQTYENALDTFSQMDDEEFAAWVAENQDMFDDDVNLNDRDSVAKSIAKQAADRTFTMDFSNVVFDIIQLYGLKNVGKLRTANQLGRTGGGASVQAAQRASIADAGEFGGKVADKTVKKFNKLRTAGNYVKDFGKKWGLTALEESTEGVEEIVNYIAQQEGITYGKALLDGKGKDYKVVDIPEWTKWASLGLTNLGEITNVISTWSNLQNPLGTYWDDAELQESAFWGFMGGLVFGGAGSAINKAQLMRANKREREGIEKQTEADGEGKKTINQKIKDIMDLADEPDAKAAKTAITKRQLHLETLKHNLDMIDAEDARNPFAEPDEHGVYPRFNSVEEKEAAREQAIRDYQQNLVMDSIFSGTYDMLLDYWQSDGNKAAMVKLFNSKENPYTIEDAQKDIDSFVKQAEHIKKEYNDMITKIMPHIDAINASKGTEYSIPISFVQEIARQNVNKQLQVEDIENQIKILEDSILNQENLNAKYSENPQEAAKQQETVKQQVKLNHLFALYQMLDMQRQIAEHSKDDWNVQKQLKHIRRQQQNVLNKIKDTILPGVNGDTTLGNNGIVAAMQFAGQYIYEFDANGNIKTDAAGNITAKRRTDNITETDDYIVEQFERVFGDKKKSKKDLDTTHDKTSAKQIKELVQKAIKDSKENETALNNTNSKLVNMYKAASELALQKSLIQGSIATQRDDIEDEVDSLYNRFNSARKRMIFDADDTVKRLYDKYAKSEDIANRLSNAIRNSYNNTDNKSAKETIEQIMSKEDAAKFLAALDVFDKVGNSRDEVYQLIMSHVIKSRLQKLHQDESTVLHEEESSSKSENSNTEQQNQEGNNISETPQETITSQETPVNEPPATPRQQIKLRLKFDAEGNYKGAENVKSRNGRGYICFVNPDGTIEVYTKGITKVEENKLVNGALLARDEGIDELEDETYVSENPILEYKNGRYIIVKQGRVSLVTEETEVPPVEENEQTQVEPKQETELDEGSKETQEVVDNLNKEQESTTEQSTISSTGESTETKDDLVPKFDPKTITTEVVESAEEEETQTNDNSGTATEELQISILENACQKAFGSVIDSHNIKPTEITHDDVDKFVTEAKQIITSQAKEKGFTDEQIDEVLNNIASTRHKAVDLIAKYTNKGQQSAVALGSFANTARREEVAPNVYGSVFDLTAKEFLKIYVENTLLPKTLDGRDVVSLEDILRIVNDAYGSIDGSVGANLFNLIKAYLNTEENQKKYKVVDNFREAYEIINDATSQYGQQLNKSRQIGQAVAERIEITTNKIINTQLKTRAEELVSQLKPGDKLETISGVGDVKLGITENGTFIELARLPKTNLYGNTYKKTNDGWVTDLTLNANGEVESNSLKVIEAIFKGDVTGVLQLDGTSVNLGTKDDIERLRQIISEWKLGSDIEARDYNNNLINKLLNEPNTGSINPTLAGLIDQSRHNNTKQAGFKNILFIEENNEPNYERVLSYLASLWNYTTLSGNSNDIELNKKLISKSLQVWFKDLYNTYGNVNNFVSQVEKGFITSVEVSTTRNTSGSLIKPVNTDGSLVFNKPSTVIDAKNKNTIHLGIVTNDNTLSISGSGKIVAPSGFGGRGNTFIMVDSNNDQPDYARAKGVSIGKTQNADEIKNNPLFPIYSAINYKLKQKLIELQKAIQTGNYNGKSEETIINEFEDLLTSIFSSVDGNGFTKNTALLRANPAFGKTNFQVAREEKDGYNSISVRYWSNKKVRAEFRIFTKTPNNSRNNIKNLSYRLSQYDPNTDKLVNGKIHTLEDFEGASAIQSNLVNNIMLIAKTCGMINISEKGIISDNDSNTPLDGFFSRTDDGKVRLNIETDDGHSYDKTSDSYSQLLLDNDLIEVNLGSDSNGKNFKERGENQKLNRAIYVSLQSVKTPLIKTTQNSNTKVNRDVIEVTSDEKLRDNIKTIIENDKESAGIEIFKQVLGVTEYNRFINIVKNDFNILEELLPKNIDYVPEINYYDPDDNTIKGVLAYTTGSTYTKFNDNGNAETGHFKQGQEVLIGARLLNALSDRNLFRRQQAVRKLIHEKLHELIKSDPNRRNDLLTAIEDIYNQFIEVIDNKSKSTNLSKVEKERLDIIKEILQPLRNKLNEDLDDDGKRSAKGRLLEEFLIETLTNSNFVNELNSIEVEGETDNGKESLFSRILKAIAKFFGWEIKDNTLYMKEVNTLANILTDNNSKPEPVIEPEVKEKPTEEEKDKNKESDNPYDQFIDYGDEEEANNSPVEEIDETYVAPIETESFNIGNIDAFKNRLPNNLQNKFEEEKNNGELSITCKH